MSTKRPRALYAPARTAHIARRLMGDGRGILSADESISTVSGRFVDESIEPSTRVRRDYRQLLLTAPGLRTTVSGIIVCDETFGQALTTGEQFPEAAAARGILVGIKMDTGPLPSPVVPQGALVTEGLEGLQARLESYATRGAAFAQWRAVFDVATPDRAVIRENAHRMAVYARWCQDADIVPIVEPEVLAAGAHNLDACRQLTRLALTTLFDALAVQGVDLAGVVLKPNFVTPGLASQPLSATTVATETFDVLRETVPSEVPGIAFLSGGHPADAACAYHGDPRLVSLLRRSDCADRVEAWASEARVEAGTIVVPVDHLPWLVGHGTQGPYPAPVSIAPDAACVVAARAQLAAAGPAPYLAVTWQAGSVAQAPPRHGPQAGHLYKSVPPGALGRALAAWPGTIVSVQRLPNAADLQAFAAGAGRPVADFATANDRLEDMLALLSAVDEYVAVSNTNVHLRVAAGREARVLVPWPPEWRWGLRGDSPWFPGLQVLRQGEDGDWSGALAALSGALQAPNSPQ